MNAERRRTTWTVSPPIGCYRLHPRDGHGLGPSMGLVGLGE